MEFIFSEQIWKDKDGNVASTHVVIMERDGYASCRLSLYPNENVQILSCVYVEERLRHIGICTEMLNAVESQYPNRRILVYVDEWAPDYVRNMYLQRGYVVMTN